MPESPYYLVMRGEEDKGGDAARWLQGEWEGSLAVESIKRTLGEEESRSGGWGCGDLGGRALVGLLACSVAEELSGLSGVLEYGGGGAEDWWAALAGIVAAPAAALLLERSGRRPLLLLGGLGACLSMALAAFLPSSPFPVASALLFLSLGPGALTPVLQAELFPSSSRSLPSALSSISATLASFLCLYFYPFLSVRLGLPILYSLFSLAAISTTSLSYFLIPETRGLTFEEIQRLFKK
jgi:MFS family permease